MVNNELIGVVVPCYRVKKHILEVLENIGPEVDYIYVVDDACPEETGKHVMQFSYDTRVKIITSSENQGVGGAVLRGYHAAIDDGVSIIVKVDGDGQMDPSLINFFIAPILYGHADYTKGNRFYDISGLESMPHIRLFGNAVLSFMSKFSTGYWNLFDPTNGFTAINANVAMHLPAEKISKRYFFETDMLFRLNTLKAVVVDIPMNSKYGDEESNLKIKNIMGEFIFKHCSNFVKRIFYNYYLRDISVASIEFPLGLLLMSFGVSYGIWNWLFVARSGLSTPAGTVMLAALPVIMGFQLLLAFLSYDIGSVPKIPISKFLYKISKS